ncbi:MAG: isopeptide-forming domain-containing fimbrial protein, partial [bacterium]|nr:isopeptide-forming domain-containing fimbrial protein [bacterium]
GDVVNYKVETNFPVYEANVASTFISAKFDITDTFDAGLKYYSTAGVKVAVNDAEVAESEDTYSLTTSDTGIVINFKSAC